MSYDEDYELEREIEARDEATHEAVERSKADRAFDENHPPMPRG